MGLGRGSGLELGLPGASCEMRNELSPMTRYGLRSAIFPHFLGWAPTH